MGGCYFVCLSGLREMEELAVFNQMPAQKSLSKGMEFKLEYGIIIKII